MLQINFVKKKVLSLVVFKALGIFFSCKRTIPVSEERLLSAHVKKKKSKPPLRSSLVVQWLGLGAFTAVDSGSVASRGTKIPQASWPHTHPKKSPLSQLSPEWPLPEISPRLTRPAHLPRDGPANHTSASCPKKTSASLDAVGPGGRDMLTT